MSVERFTKQPAETLDYDFSFTEWLASKPGRSIVSHTVTADPGITITHERNAAVVKVYVAGGTSGQRYKVTVRVTTDGTTPLVKELEAFIAVREV
jgi:uncharacterized protein with NRDE domain